MAVCSRCRVSLRHQFPFKTTGFIPETQCAVRLVEALEKTRLNNILSDVSIILLYREIPAYILQARCVNCTVINIAT